MTWPVGDLNLEDYRLEDWNMGLRDTTATDQPWYLEMNEGSRQLFCAVRESLVQNRVIGDPDDLDRIGQGVVSALLGVEEGRVGWLLMGYSETVLPLIECDMQSGSDTWLVWGPGAGL